MRPLIWFCIGAVTAVVLSAAVAWGFISASARGFSANQPPTRIEEWAARTARESALTSETKRRRNSVPNSPEVLREARSHWADHCATCHGNDGSGRDSMGAQMYPPAPDMRKRETQDMADGEIFYIIQNGIRLSGMPAWSSGHGDEEDSWKLVHFIRRLPHLSRNELQEMEKLNPKSPDDLKEQQEEQQFLQQQPSPPAEGKHQHR